MEDLFIALCAGIVELFYWSGYLFWRLITWRRDPASKTRKLSRILFVLLGIAVYSIILLIGAAVFGMFAISSR
jgi:cytochrome c oxidase assembly factor CtaG